ncbi:hypothetical protein lacNasYZ03_00390 [Lactobacillus nasalidis]|uniref:Transposase n=1 Tax=Lactobacillus nasalidis TaxID=2797258 RepID=A0ABQ3W838_9LACO|nr:hypothetical protein lacNasYZ01_17070 [Lactobacillus nasalidis]GHW00020.1 hypothetical protein lacNasYZ02_14490 [Lactobacillus nasalidis]GHW00352.1 hypothetical protein lacNasYZ03_00390 [Lactobacillus nasalidis]
MKKSKYQGLYTDQAFCSVLKKDETAMRVCQTVFQMILAVWAGIAF